MMRSRLRATAGLGLAAACGDACAMLSLCVLVLALFWRAALLRGYLYLGDILFFFEPVKALLHESLRAGRLPLWSPWIFAGYPIAAEGQIAAFYPVSLLVSWLLPAPAAINWLVILHVSLASVSMHMLARRLGASPFGGWLAGLTYGFSGFLFAHLHHVSLLCAASWMPLVIYFVEGCWQSALLPNATLAAGAWAAAALCGHPQMLFYISLVVLFWVAWRWCGRVRAGGRAAHRRAIGVLLLIFGLGPALAAVQLLPTAALARAEPRGETGSLSYITSFSLLPRDLLGLVRPRWMHVLYIGLLPLGLAILGGTRRRGWPLAGLGMAALLLALGASNPLYEVLRFLPGFSWFRAPERYVSIFVFSAALLAASGWDSLAARARRRDGRRLLILGSIVGVVAAGNLLWFDHGLTPLAPPAMLSEPNRAATVLHRDKTWWRARVMPPSPVRVNWTPPDGFYGDPSGWGYARAVLPADVPQSYHIRIPDGYAGFWDRDETLFVDVAYGRAQVGDRGLLSLLGVKYLVLSQDRFPGLTGPRVGPFVIFRNPDAFPRAFTVSQGIPVRDGREAHHETVLLARTGRLRQVAAVQGSGGRLPSSIGGAPAPPSPRAAEPRASGVRGPPAVVEAKSSVTVSEPRPERIHVQATASQDCLLVLNEHYDGGWRARLDGRPAPLLNVDIVLMGTPLPKGSHQVEFLYQPRAFLIGRAVTLSALVLAGSLLGGEVWRRRRSRHGMGVTARVLDAP